MSATFEFRLCCTVPGVWGSWEDDWRPWPGPEATIEAINQAAEDNVPAPTDEFRVAVEAHIPFGLVDEWLDVRPAPRVPGGEA